MKIYLEGSTPESKRLDFLITSEKKPFNSSLDSAHELNIKLRPRLPCDLQTLTGKYALC